MLTPAGLHDQGSCVLIIAGVRKQQQDWATGVAPAPGRSVAVGGGGPQARTGTPEAGVACMSVDCSPRVGKAAWEGHGRLRVWTEPVSSALTGRAGRVSTSVGEGPAWLPRVAVPQAAPLEPPRPPGLRSPLSPLQDHCDKPGHIRQRDPLGLLSCPSPVPAEVPTAAHCPQCIVW